MTNLDYNFRILLVKKPFSIFRVLYNIVIAIFTRVTGLSSSYSQVPFDYFYTPQAFPLPASFKFSTGLTPNPSSYRDDYFTLALNQKSIFDRTFFETTDRPLDPEFLWSLFQANWLLYLFQHKELSFSETENYFCRIIDLISSSSYLPFRRTFTVSEISVNIIKFTSLVPNTTFHSKITSFLEFSRHFIVSNIEIYSDNDFRSLNFTNNHVLHNIRALFFLSNYFNDRSLFLYSKSLFDYFSKSLFDRGVLNEGSTHYHFISQILVNDIALFYPDALNVINTNFTSLLYGFYVLSSNQQFTPAVGDISPDPSIPYCLAHLEYQFSSNTFFNFPIHNLKVYRFQHFAFFRCGNFKCFLHCRVGPLHQQHSHNDLLAPSLWLKEIPIMLDVGRLDYTRKSIASTLTKFHSVPQINCLDHAPRRYRDLYPSSFLINSFDCFSYEQMVTHLLDLDISSSIKPIYGGRITTFATRLSNGSWYRFICRTNNNSALHIIDHLHFSNDVETSFRYFLACDAADYVMIDFETSIKIKSSSLIDASHNYLYSNAHTPNALCYEYHFPKLSSVVTNFSISLLS